MVRDSFRELVWNQMYQTVRSSGGRLEDFVEISTRWWSFRHDDTV